MGQEGPNVGQGGQVDAVMSVTAGQVLNIFVGGSPRTDRNPDRRGFGGYNGGGNGRMSSPGFGGNGGGGATDIRIGGTALSNRVLVAGGAGGDGNAGGGGHGGGLIGGAGAGTGGNNATGGSGGTQSAGGGAGIGNPGAGFGGTNGNSGSEGQGGDTAPIGSFTTLNGGGGGGGYYGGGSGGVQITDAIGSGGGGGGGGGGSSYPDPNALPVGSPVIAVTHTQGGNGNLGGVPPDGRLTISYQTTSLSLSLITQTTPNPTSSSATVSVTATNGTGPLSYTWIAPADITLTGGTNSSSVQATSNACITGLAP